MFIWASRHLTPVWPFSSDHWHQQGFFGPENGYFLFLRLSSVNSEIPRPAHLAPTAMPCIKHHRNNLFSSTFWCSVCTLACQLNRVYLPECMELLPCDWLKRQLPEQVYQWSGRSVYIKIGQHVRIRPQHLLETACCGFNGQIMDLSAKPQTPAWSIFVFLCKTRFREGRNRCLSESVRLHTCVFVYKQERVFPLHLKPFTNKMFN